MRACACPSYYALDVCFSKNNVFPFSSPIQTSQGDGWGSPAIKLEHSQSKITLVPIGSTVLRRSTFLLKPAN